jgi:hypothetical protein
MKPIWRIFTAYMFFLLLMFCCGKASGQIVVTQFTADWNKQNEPEWFGKLKECELAKVDIVEHTKLQKKYGIIIVPTIIIFNNGEEVKRFQADISFKMVATRKEVQEEIDNLIMNKF